MTSTCPDNVVTSWNTNDKISDNLMKWIKGVTFHKPGKDVANGKHCKTISTKKNDFFSLMAREIYSPNVNILGKVAHHDDDKDREPSRRKFVGPIWATMNDQFEWIFENNKQNKLEAKLSTEALLHNGLYYGTLDNDVLSLD